MKKLLPILIMPLMMLQLLLLPSTIEAQDQPVQVECPVVVTFTTLPPTEVTGTTAVFNGQLTQVIRFRLSPQEEEENPFVFEYGTEPGVYPYRVSAELVSQVINGELSGEDGIITWLVTFSGAASNLSPCTTYYVRLRFLDTIPFPPNCLEIIGPSEISFRTAGCLIGTGSHGAGGFNGTTIGQPTNLSNIVVQSAAIASTRVSPGQKADVTAYIVNKGNSNGSSKVTLFVAGQQVESKGINLAGGESAQVHFSVSQNEPGTYPVYVNGVPAGNLTVDLFTNNDALIYGVIALFTIGIVGVLYLVIRRRTT